MAPQTAVQNEHLVGPNVTAGSLKSETCLERAPLLALQSLYFSTSRNIAGKVSKMRKGV